jgi:hypothetical protein
VGDKAREMPFVVHKDTSHRAGNAIPIRPSPFVAAATRKSHSFKSAAESPRAERRKKIAAAGRLKPRRRSTLLYVSF